jgi:hypothetical protein
MPRADLRHSGPLLGGLFLLALALAATIARSFPPRPLDNGARPDEFSAGRASQVLRTLVGDGSVRTVSVGADVHASLCFRDVQLQRNVQDGTSNTILLSESVGLSFSGGVVSPFTDARGIVDGTSNTIAFPETTSVARDICFGNVGNLDPVIPPGITDGTSNTILIGERSRFDLCLSRAGVPTITDGTSNTIVFGETRTNACFYDIVPAADITVVSTVPEPTPLALIVTSLLALTFARRRPLQ